MKNLIYVLALFGLLSACKKNSYSTIPPDQLITPQLIVTEGISPFTGALDIYPCYPASETYYGNYVDGKLSVFNGLYTISEGNIYSSLRPITLPVGNYNLIYWGVSQIQEPTTKGAIREPSISLNSNLLDQIYQLRKYPSPSDTTYQPVYDFVFNTQPVNIGTEDLAVSLRRVVSGITITLKKADNSKLDSQIASINVLVGTIAEDLKFATGEPENQTKTVRFPMVIAEDSLTAVSVTALVFPSAPNPPLKVVITLQNGQERTFTTILNNTLTANTKITVTIDMGQLFSTETSGGGFEVTNWQEKSETVTATPAS